MNWQIFVGLVQIEMLSGVVIYGVWMLVKLSGKGRYR